MKRRNKILILLVSIFIGLFYYTLSLAAAEEVYTIVTDQNAVLNHDPGTTDSLIGTGDDGGQRSVPSAMNASAPNSLSSYSYNAFDFGSGLTETNFPPNRNAITFIQGTVTIDPAAFAGGSNPVLLNWEVSGTEPYTGHGAYSAQISQVNSGTYDSDTHAFTLNVDFTCTLTSGPDEALNFPISGIAYLVNKSEFGQSTGNSYVDSVLIPLAQNLGAASLFFIYGNGVVPSAQNSSFPSMPVTAAIVAVQMPGGALVPLINLLLDD